MLGRYTSYIANWVRDSSAGIEDRGEGIAAREVVHVDEPFASGKRPAGSSALLNVRTALEGANGRTPETGRELGVGTCMTAVVPPKKGGRRGATGESWCGFPDAHYELLDAVYDGVDAGASLGESTLQRW